MNLKGSKGLRKTAAERGYEGAILDRLPPGQVLTTKWPVLHEGDIPEFNPDTWRFTTSGLVANPLSLSWSDFNALKPFEDVSDFHCVTRWSKLDNHWKGVAVKTILDLTRPASEVKHVTIHCYGGYTTNLPLHEFADADALFATMHNGQALEPEHGGPMRLVVPKLYAWKSAKWVSGVEFMAQDRRGFWEVRGYHNHADPWKEERYSWQESGNSDDNFTPDSK
ncbi:MAG: Sulfoxide reductase catalytic subunit YedY [Myxococcota bacterium]|nr:Sulfoxide reductase catalytic subunit YedY [Myxococcota bacterium]